MKRKKKRKVVNDVGSVPSDRLRHTRKRRLS